MVEAESDPANFMVLLGGTGVGLGGARVGVHFEDKHRPIRVVARRIDLLIFSCSRRFTTCAAPVPSRHETIRNPARKEKCQVSRIAPGRRRFRIISQKILVSESIVLFPAQRKAQPPRGGAVGCSALLDRTWQFDSKKATVTVAPTQKEGRTIHRGDKPDSRG